MALVKFWKNLCRIEEVDLQGVKSPNKRNLYIETRLLLQASTKEQSKKLFDDVGLSKKHCDLIGEKEASLIKF